MRKGEELKAPRYASAAATRDYIIARDIIPNNYNAKYIYRWHITKKWYIGKIVI